ncbi:MAG: DUF4249 domain-containing protein [bacterium]|jgi:hypothetical protein
MILKLRYFVCGILFFTASSCEKDINIELDPSQPKVVIDATIENERNPIVYLSKSLDYFTKISPEALSDAFLHDAIIVVSDGSSQIQLKEYSVKGEQGVMIYYYTVTTQDISFLGKINNTYTMTIDVNGERYVATTNIPDTTRRIDSLWWQPVPFSKKPDEMNIFIKATDRPGLGDYIRYFTKVNSQAYLPGFNSVYDDQIIDGRTYSIAIDKGFDKNEGFNDSTAYFKRGDTVMIKLCNIDKQTYDFWRTFEFSYQSIGNPFSSPTRILSNFNNDALGYFGGYAAQYRRVIIPR